MLSESIILISRLLVLLTLGSARPAVMERVTLQELQTATGGRAIACDPAMTVFDGVAIDSRTIRPGDLFWALEGAHRDGHEFVKDAMGRGAVACVVQENKAVAGKIPAVVVPDVLKGLQDFARSHRQRMDALVIGVTGSVGKTTTREIVYSVLDTAFEGCRSPKNYNNHIGLPLSVLDIESRHEVAVLELGASRGGEIRDLAEIAQPEIGVLTNVGVAHLDSFGNIDAIAAAKGELLESLPRSGFAVINGDDPRCQAQSTRARCRVIAVGEQSHNTVRATSIDVGQHSIRLSVSGTNYELPAVGRHHVVGALAAIAIAQELGIKVRDIMQGFSQFVPASGRCEVRLCQPWTLIDDTYNANPSSVEAACRLIGQWKADGRRILVLGDMLELGTQSAAWHASIGRSAAELGVNRLVAVGRYSHDLLTGARQAGMTSEQVAHCDDLTVAEAVLGCWIEPGDVVLVKGSRAMRMERVVKMLIEQSNNQETIAPCGSMRACA
jgi:UDP-N-acetylmuramoyl-tripeptide--D-alanyl-D-alanine ligase